MNEIELKQQSMKQVRLILNSFIPDASNYDDVIAGIMNRIQMTEDHIKINKELKKLNNETN